MQSSEELKISKLSKDGKIFTGGFSEIVKGESMEDFITNTLNKSSEYIAAIMNIICYNSSVCR